MLSIKKKQNTKTIILLLFCIFSLFYLSTIAYSAFSSTMNITGIAASRVEADVRITDFNLTTTTNNAKSMYEQFSKDTIASHIILPSSSSITYEIQITNYATTDVGIFSISGLPENVTYSISNYKLKDKICDETGKCNTIAKKTLYLEINNNSTQTIEESININLDFRNFYKITYNNLDNNNFPDEIISGEILEIDLNNNPPLLVEVRGNEQIIESTYNNNILIIENITSNIEIEGIYTVEYQYDYTGNYQTFSVPYVGIYKIELWGAQGGGFTSYEGGKGAYVKGEIELIKGTNLFIYVGGAGKGINGTTRTDAGGYNGGGSAKTENTNSDSRASSGGGATDIRLTSGSWNNTASLNSRIMVAGGGGGSDYSSSYSGNGGAGGGLTGYNGTSPTSGYGTGGSQTAGGLCYNSQSFSSAKGGFGYGGTFQASNYDGANSGMGGSGYYGGGAGLYNRAAGGGGSSFISGHNGCNAIDTNGSHTSQSIHYSNYVFANTIMIDGKGYTWTNVKGSQTGMPTHDGTSTMTGNSGNGYAKITLIELT